MKNTHFHQHLTLWTLAALLLPIVLPALAVEKIPDTIPEPPSIHATARKFAVRGEEEVLNCVGRCGGDPAVFFHEEKDGKVIWKSVKTSPYKAKIIIDRYFGSKEERDRMVANGLMSRKAILVVPSLDCDSEYYSSDKWAPERDRLYLNGHYVGYLWGDNDCWRNNSFEVPLDWLKFPSSPGDKAENHLEIRVDTANGGEEIWILGQVWQGIILSAPDPVMLVHGWTDEQSTLNELAAAITEETGIITAQAQVVRDASPEENAEIVQNALVTEAKKMGVEKFLVVGHSKGGLDLRPVIDAKGLNSPYVRRALQIGTPNAGSKVADIVANPQTFKQWLVTTIAKWKEKIDVANPGFLALTTEGSHKFNETYKAPNAPIHTIIGFVLPEYLEGLYKTIVKICDLPQPNDGIVSVASAHALGTAVPQSPLDSGESSLYDHCAIVRGEGKKPVVALIKELSKASVTRFASLNPTSENRTSLQIKTRSAAEFSEETPAESPATPAETPLSGNALQDEPVLVSGSTPWKTSVTFLKPGRYLFCLGFAPEDVTVELKLSSEATPRSLVLEREPEDGDSFLKSMGLCACDIDLEQADTGVFTIRVPEDKEETAMVFLLRGAVDIPKFHFQAETGGSDGNPGREALFTAWLASPLDDTPLTTGLQSVVTTVAPYESQETPITMNLHDDGQGGDAVAGDGIFSGRFVPDTPNFWVAKANAQVSEDSSYAGMEFADRSSFMTFPGESAIQLPLEESWEDLPAGVQEIPEYKKNLILETAVTTTKPGTYTLQVDLRDANGQPIYATCTWTAAESSETHECRVVVSPDEWQKLKVQPWKVHRVMLYWEPSVIEGTQDSGKNPWKNRRCIRTVYPEQSLEAASVPKSWSNPLQIRLTGTGTAAIQDADSLAGGVVDLKLPVEVEGWEEYCSDLKFTPVPKVSMLVSTETGRLVGRVNGTLVRAEDGTFYIDAQVAAQGGLSLELEDASYILSDGQVTFPQLEDGSEPFFVQIEGEFRTGVLPVQDLHRNLLVDKFTADKEELTSVVDNKDLTVIVTRNDDTTPSSDERFFLYLTALGDISYYVENTIPLGDWTERANIGYESVLEVTEQVRELLPTIGNGDDLWDAGEELLLSLETMREIPEMLYPCLGLMIVKRDTPTSEKILEVLHPLDENENLAISLPEVQTGRTNWSKGTLDPTVLLNGIMLLDHQEYRYNSSRRNFLPRRIRD